MFPAGGKGSGSDETCDFWNNQLNGDQVSIDAAWNNGNDNDAEHGLDGYFTAIGLFEQDYNAALDAGCAVVD